MLPITEAVLDLLWEEAGRRPLQPIDQKLIHLASKLIMARYQRGYHQLASAGLGKSGKIHMSLQLDAKAAHNSVCAEAGVITRGFAENLDVITRIATVRGVPAEDGNGASGTELVEPCAGCRSRIIQFAGPLCQVILPFNGQPKKLPIEPLYILAFEKRERPSLPSEALREQWSEEWAAAMREDFPYERIFRPIPIPLVEEKNLAVDLAKPTEGRGRIWTNPAF